MSKNSGGENGVRMKSMSGDIAVVILLVYLLLFDYVFVFSKMTMPLSQPAIKNLFVSVFASVLTIVAVLHSERPFSIMAFVLAMFLLTGVLVIKYGYIWYQTFWAWFILTVAFGKPWRAFR